MPTFGKLNKNRRGLVPCLPVDFDRDLGVVQATTDAYLDHEVDFWFHGQVPRQAFPRSRYHFVDTGLQQTAETSSVSSFLSGKDRTNPNAGISIRTKLRHMAWGFQKLQGPAICADTEPRGFDVMWFTWSLDTFEISRTGCAWTPWFEQSWYFSSTGELDLL